MPTYEYNCVTCDTKTEVRRSFDEEEKTPPCPKCGYNMTRVFNTFGIHFNAKGFYSTGG